MNHLASFFKEKQQKYTNKQNLKIKFVECSSQLRRDTARWSCVKVLNTSQAVKKRWDIDYQERHCTAVFSYYRTLMPSNDCVIYKLWPQWTKPQSYLGLLLAETQKCHTLGFLLSFKKLIDKRINLSVTFSKTVLSGRTRPMASDVT